MPRSASNRSAPKGSSCIAATTASATKRALSALECSSSKCARILGASRLTHWRTVVTTARTELHDNGRRRSFAASAAGARASSWRGVSHSGSTTSTLESNDSIYHFRAPQPFYQPLYQSLHQKIASEELPNALGFAMYTIRFACFSYFCWPMRGVITGLS